MATNPPIRWDATGATILPGTITEGPIYGNTVLASLPRGFWRFSETAGGTAYDSTWHAANAQIHGGVTQGVAGPTTDNTPAFAFDGSTAYVLTPLTLTATGALGAWIYPTDLSVTGTIAATDAWGSATGLAWGLLPSGTLAVSVGTGSSAVTLSGTVPVTANVWTYVTLSLTSTMAQLFHNGVAVGGGPAVFAPSGQPLQWGRSPGGQYWTGRLADAVLDPAPIPTVSTAAGYDLYQQTVLNDAPVLYYRMDTASGTTVTDLSPSHNDGTITGGATLNQPGALADGNPAITLDGSTGYVSLPNVAVTAYSIEAWLNPGSHSTFMGIINGIGAGQLNYYLNTQSQLYFYTTNTNGQRTEFGPVPTALPGGAWSHTVLTAGPAGRAIYINGALALSDDVVPEADVFNQLGASNGHYWAGSMDDVAIYSAVLTPPQIAAHCHAGQARNAVLAPRVLRALDGAGFDATGHWMIGGALTENRTDTSATQWSVTPADHWLLPGSVTEDAAVVMNTALTGVVQ